MIEDSSGIFLPPVPAPASPQPGPLSGLRLAVKDNIDVAGLPTRAGLGRAVRHPTRDAPVVAALRAAGCIVIGKTSMDEAAFGATGDNPHTGRCPNPAAPGRSPGGSSSGSAAAVAAGLADVALGTDTMGSVRIPAAYCGVAGFLPSPGLLSLDGVVPLSPRLDRVGVLARDLATVAHVLDCFGATPYRGPAVPRVGVPCLPPLHPDVGAALDRAEEVATALGWHVVRNVMPDWNHLGLRRAALLVAEADGARVHAALLATADDPALSDAVRRLLRYGRDAAPDRVASARAVLDAAAALVASTWQVVEVLLLPTTTHAAFRWTDGPPVDQADLTVLANAAGSPAASVPFGSSEDAAPLGLQLVAPSGQDRALLRWAGSLDGRSGALAWRR